MYTFVNFILFAAFWGNALGFIIHNQIGCAAPIEPLTSPVATGIGNVAVAGDIPVAGFTEVEGAVPVVGEVIMYGPVYASGAVTVIGACEPPVIPEPVNPVITLAELVATDGIVVTGEVPVRGATLVAGSVPIMGEVSFGGYVPAKGSVVITACCRC